MTARLYQGNAKTNPISTLQSGNRIQPCVSLTNIDLYDFSLKSWSGSIQLCKLQPGAYTLVLYGTDNDIGKALTPTLRIEKVESSRFDMAANAYDFGNVPGDSTWYDGKLGEVNPFDTGRAASNDFFTCNTGAFDSDPGPGEFKTLCFDGQILYPTQSIVQPMTDDYAVYNNGSTTGPPRRTLWYSFTITGPGRVHVRVNNFGAQQSPFSVYESDVSSADAASKSLKPIVN